MRYIFGIILSMFPVVSAAQEAAPSNDKWRDCVMSAANLYAAATQESADVIALGAFGKCETHLHKYVEALTTFAPLNPVQFLKTVKDAEDTSRNSVIAQVLDARSKAE